MSLFKHSRKDKLVDLYTKFAKALKKSAQAEYDLDPDNILKSHPKLSLAEAALMAAYLEHGKSPDEFKEVIAKLV